MAFVKIEDKYDEIEVIVFPGVFADVGAKLEVDNVIRVKGRVNATDAGGNRIDEAKINAEEVILVTDDELENYKPTGEKMQAPAKGVATKKRFRNSASTADKVGKSVNMGGSTKAKKNGEIVDAKPMAEVKLFIQIEDPMDNEKLSAMREVCMKKPGLSQVILVFTDSGEKTAMRMPFRCEVTEKLLANLRKIFGEECVKTV